MTCLVKRKRFEPGSMSFRSVCCGEAKELHLAPFAFNCSFQHLGIGLLDSSFISRFPAGMSPIALGMACGTYYAGLINWFINEEQHNDQSRRFEAKTHLSSLLDKVSRGEEVVITRRGKAVARLVPAAQAERSRLSATINTLLTLRKEVRLQGVDWKALRDRGRR